MPTIKKTFYIDHFGHITSVLNLMLISLM